MKATILIKSQLTIVDWEEISVDLKLLCNNFHARKYIWKCFIKKMAV